MGLFSARGTYVPGFWSEYGLNETFCMLIVAVVEISPFDGLSWSNGLRLNCVKKGTIHIYDDR